MFFALLVKGIAAVENQPKSRVKSLFVILGEVYKAIYYCTMNGRRITGLMRENYLITRYSK